MKRTSDLRQVLAPALALIALSAAGCMERGSAATKNGPIPADGLFTVKRGELPISLTENGTLVAKESKKVTPQLRGRGKITFIVEEGKVVNEGDELCKFDTTELQQQIDQMQLDLAKSEVDLQTAQTELEIQEKQNVSDRKKADITLEKAQKDQEKFEKADAKQTRRGFEVAIHEANVNFEQAKKGAEDAKTLFEHDFITKNELDQAQQALERYTVAKERAEQDAKIFEDYTYPMTTRDKVTAIEDATLALETAQKRAESTLRQKQVAVEQNQKRLDKMKQQDKEKKEELEKMILKAPCPGIVIYGDPRYSYYNMDEQLKIGGEVWGGNTLFTIPDLRVMQVKLQIHEADINKIKVEMPARVTMDTYPGLLMTGKITKIAAIAAGAGNPWERDQEVKKFDVEITLESKADVELKPGISAKAEILIDTRKDATYVPLQCVFLEAGKHWCFGLGADQKPDKREVKPGLSNDSYLEILDGLKEGEQVLLYNPNVPKGATPPGEEKKEEESKESKPTAPAGPPPARPTQ